MARASSPPDAARGQRLDRLADVGAEGELNGLPRALGADPHLQTRPGHGEGAQPLAHPVAERTGGPGPHGPHGRFGVGQLDEAHVALGLQAECLDLRVLQRGQAQGALAAVGHDGGEVLPVLTPQLAEQAPALLHLDEALRIVLPAFDLVAQSTGEVGELDGGRGQAGVVALEGLPARQRAAGATEQVDGPALARRVDQLQCRERGVAIRRSVGQPVLFEPEGGLLVGVLQVGAGDLLYLVAQHVGFAGSLLGIAAESGQRLVECEQLAPEGPHQAEIRAGEGIEDVALGDGRDEGAVLVLPVDLDQRGGRLAQRGERRHAAVHPGPGSPFGRNGTGQDHFAGGVTLPHHETGLHESLRGSGAHHARIGPAAQDQLQGLDHQGLARTRLTGEGGHSGPEDQGQVLDHTQIAHVQIGQHDRITGPGGREAGSAGCPRRSGARCARRARVARPRCR